MFFPLVTEQNKKGIIRVYNKRDWSYSKNNKYKISKLGFSTNDLEIIRKLSIPLLLAIIEHTHNIEEKKRQFIIERDAIWKDFAFKAAHKLGNPIDAIDTFLLSLKKRLENHLIADAFIIVDEINISIEKSKDVISQLKSLTRAQEINIKKIDIIQIINHAKKIAEEKGVKVHLHSPANCPLIEADPDKIADCFNELVANSIHWFNKSDKKITIHIESVIKKDLPESLDKSLNFLKIIYEDNGKGILPENKEKIFSPFFTTHMHGAGLGLSLVKTIIDSHKGLIFEKGKFWDGAIFEIYLPIVKI